MLQNKEHDGPPKPEPLTHETATPLLRHYEKRGDGLVHLPSDLLEYLANNYAPEHQDRIDLIRTILRERDEQSDRLSHDIDED